MKSSLLVLLGATGDLVIRKIIPSLYLLYSEKKLPQDFKVIAFARRDFNDGKYLEIIKESLGRIPKYAQMNEETLQEFASIFTYCQGDLDSDESYIKLKNEIDKFGDQYSKIFYLSIAQTYYPVVSQKLSDILTNEDKLIVEKPYGMDEKSARELDKDLLEYFSEEQIYRIDHYLAKTLVREIIDIRSSDKFKNKWNSDNIKSIRIATLEDIDVKNRGDFYEVTGALRDVGQNHLLAIASFLTCSLDFSNQGEFAQNRLNALKNIKAGDSLTSIRRQYKKYRSTTDVDPDSKVETYFNLQLENNGPIFKSLPILIEGGKGLPETEKVIEVEFNDGKLIFDYAKVNSIFFKGNNGETEIIFDGTNNEVQYTAEYSKLILECVKGDKTYFPLAEEIFEMWRIVDPVIKYWESTEAGLTFY